MRAYFLLVSFVLATVSGCYCVATPYPYPYTTYPFGPANTTPRGSLVVANYSSGHLTQVSFAATNDPTWGPNLIAKPIHPGDQVTVTVDCNTYDVLVGDEFGRQCVLPHIDLCQSTQVWAVYDDTLANCAVPQ